MVQDRQGYALNHTMVGRALLMIRHSPRQNRRDPQEYYATAYQSQETSAEEKGDSDYVRMAKGDV